MKNSSTPYSAIIKTPIGHVGFTITDTQLIKVDFLKKATAKLVAPTSSLAKTVALQLEHYFRDPNYSFSLPLHIEGTPFQQKVWQAMLTIPAGKPMSYGTLAKQLNTSARAIGNACRKNPIPIIIPCHRIIAHNGLGGFNGARQGEFIDTKTWLLKHEGFTI